MLNFEEDTVTEDDPPEDAAGGSRNNAKRKKNRTGKIKSVTVSDKSSLDIKLSLPKLNLWLKLC